MKWKTEPTLTSRVTLWLTLLSVGLFLMVGFIALMVTLGNEDAMIHNILRNVSQNKLHMQGVVKEQTIEQLIDFGYEGAPKEALAKRVNSFGEFPKGEQYFHFMILEDKVLLINTTNLVISPDRLKNILTLQLKVFIPFLLLAFFISKLIAKRSLKPFSVLQEQYLKPDRQAADIRQLNQKIREADIRKIADGLATALEQKEQVLEQQITFNQGISHELRTPLQVMTHAAELMALKNPELKKQDVYQRLSNSISRMHRMGEALLWLTSNVKSDHHIQVNLTLANLKFDVEQAFDEHGLSINIVEHDKLSLPFPKAVFEFIVYNLATNAVHHAKKENGVIALQIEITNNSLAFKNLMNDHINDSENSSKNKPTNFGIGLTLIDKLCQRFGVIVYTEPMVNHYIVKLKLKSNN